MVTPLCPNCEKGLLQFRAGMHCDCGAGFGEHIHFKAECLICDSLFDAHYYENNELMEIYEF